MKKLEKEQQQLLADMRALYRRHIRQAVDADDVKTLVELIKQAQVAKDWLWIYDETANPWATDSVASSKAITVRIYGDNDLV